MVGDLFFEPLHNLAVLIRLPIPDSRRIVLFPLRCADVVFAHGWYLSIPSSAIWPNVLIREGPGSYSSLMRRGASRALMRSRRLSSSAFGIRLGGSASVRSTLARMAEATNVDASKKRRRTSGFFSAARSPSPQIGAITSLIKMRSSPLPGNGCWQKQSDPWYRNLSARPQGDRDHQGSNRLRAHARGSKPWSQERPTSRDQQEQAHGAK